MAASIEPFWGDRPDKNAQDFFCTFNRAMGDKSDDIKCRLFVNYLRADSEADEWYAALPAAIRADWDDTETAFHARWPKATIACKTALEYEEEILAMKLKEATLGSKETVAGRDVYTHIAWADRMGALVSRAGLVTGTTYVRLVQRTLPALIREKTVSAPADWAAFLASVQSIDIDYIRDGTAEAEREREKTQRFDERVRMLEAQASPTRGIRNQLAQTTIAAASPNRQAGSEGNPFLNTRGGQGHLSYGATAQGGRGGGAGGTRATRAPPTKEDHAALRARLAEMVHHPDTEAGRTTHRAQQQAWATKYGHETRVNELTPYPLCPGTLGVNANECFGCGMTGHIAPKCSLPSDRRLNVCEADWHAICRYILKVPFATLVRYVVIDDYGGVAAVDT
ncbi:hypothetical protein D9615_010133 [Tricholomella constricta]|uniref:CCHC-type domain-containing protein n=1 Tax=Tricholomella constricta TaxID=117010 RepID=A0A8H5GXQ3_9AGAR|nr:hypothetical protein D9615_010133 [Tricholomella constricta]